MLSYDLHTHRRARTTYCCPHGPHRLHHRCRLGWLAGRKALSGCGTTCSNTVSGVQANAIENPEIEPGDRFFLAGLVSAASLPALPGKAFCEAERADYGSGGAKSAGSPVLQRRRDQRCYRCTAPVRSRVRKDHSRLGETCALESKNKPSQRDWFRRIADEANGGHERLNWADSDRSRSGGNGRDSGRTRAVRKAWCPPMSEIAFTPRGRTYQSRGRRSRRTEGV
jgi:hypothetical protein